jgi:hypothetical protein
VLYQRGPIHVDGLRAVGADPCDYPDLVLDGAAMNWILLITAVLRIIPLIMEMIRDGRIKEATTAEVLRAFEQEFYKRWNARVDAAVAAGNNVGGVPVTSEGNDPFDRAAKRKDD